MSVWSRLLYQVKWTFHATVLLSLIFLFFYIQVLSESNSNLRTPRTILEQKQSGLGMCIQLKFCSMSVAFHLPVVLHSCTSFKKLRCEQDLVVFPINNVMSVLVKIELVNFLQQKFLNKSQLKRENCLRLFTLLTLYWLKQDYFYCKVD